MTVRNVSIDPPVLLGSRAVGGHEADLAEEEKAQQCGSDGIHDSGMPVVEEKPHHRIRSVCRRWNPISWLKMLYGTFGCFVWLAMLCYLQQGFTQSSMKFASKYYMMNELKLDGVTMGRYMAVAHLPWNLKPIWGMLTDAMPLFGFHRRSYLVLMCCFSIAIYLWIGATAVSAMGIVIFMTSIHLYMALSDLVIDATASSVVKSHPAEACDLQTMFSAAFATGGVIVGTVSGTMVSKLSPRGTLMSNILWPMALLAPALRGWLPEERRSPCCMPRLELFRHNSTLTLSSAFLAMLAVSVAVSQFFLPNWQSRTIVLIACTMAVLVATYKAFRKMSPYLWKVGLLLFLRPCLAPNLGECMFVWMSKHPDGPLFTPELLGVAESAGKVGLLFGVVIFNQFLRSWKYRNIMVLGQVLAILTSLLDLILVLRWNQVIGIPDAVFLVGDDALEEAVERTFWVPLMILAFKSAPTNLEATVLSTLLGLRCIGVDCGKFLGVALAEIWGIVDGNFDHLPHGIISKAMVRLLLIPILLVLAPDLTPEDPVPGSDPLGSRGPEPDEAKIEAQRSSC